MGDYGQGPKESPTGSTTSRHQQQHQHLLDQYGVRASTSANSNQQEDPLADVYDPETFEAEQRRLQAAQAQLRATPPEYHPELVKTEGNFGAPHHYQDFHQQHPQQYHQYPPQHNPNYPPPYHQQDPNYLAQQQHLEQQRAFALEQQRVHERHRAMEQQRAMEHQRAVEQQRAMEHQRAVEQQRAMEQQQRAMEQQQNEQQHNEQRLQDLAVNSHQSPNTSAETSRPTLPPFRTPPNQSFDDSVVVIKNEEHTPLQSPAVPMKNSPRRRNYKPVELSVVYDADHPGEDPEPGKIYPEPQLLDAKTLHLTENELEVMKTGKTRFPDDVPDANSTPNKIVEYLMSFRILKENEINQLNSYRTRRNQLSLNLIRQNPDREFDQKACESLVKKLKDKKSDLQNLIDVVVTKGQKFRDCITIPRTLDGRLQVHGKKGFPHVVYGRLWRFADMSKNETRNIESCKHPFESKTDQVKSQPEPDPDPLIPNPDPKPVCVNPFHYEIVAGAMIIGHRENEREREKLVQATQQQQALPATQIPAPQIPPQQPPPPQQIHPMVSPRHAPPPTQQMHPMVSPRHAPPPPQTPQFSPQHQQYSPHHQQYPPHPPAQYQNQNQYPNPNHNHHQHYPNQHQPNQYHANHINNNHRQHQPHPQQQQHRQEYEMHPGPYQAPHPQQHQQMDQYHYQHQHDPNNPGSNQRDPRHRVDEYVPLNHFRHLCKESFGKRFFGPNSRAEVQKPPYPKGTYQYSPFLGVTHVRRRLTSTDDFEKREEMPKNGPYSDMNTNMAKLGVKKIYVNNVEPPSKRNPGNWATIVYYEYTKKLNDREVTSNDLLIDGGFEATGARYCLGLEPNPERTKQSFKVRRLIGKGVRFSIKENGDVWIQNQTDFPIFTTSGYLDDQSGGMRTEKVHKIYPMAKMKVFGFANCKELIRDQLYSAQMASMYLLGQNTPMDRQYRTRTEEEIQEEAKKNTDSLQRFCLVRVAFAKGFGLSFAGKPEIKNTPCWLELKINCAFDFMDRVVTDLANTFEPLTLEDFAKLGIDVSEN